MYLCTKLVNLIRYYICIILYFGSDCYFSMRVKDTWLTGRMAGDVKPGLRRIISIVFFLDTGMAVLISLLHICPYLLR